MLHPFSYSNDLLLIDVEVPCMQAIQRDFLEKTDTDSNRLWCINAGALLSLETEPLCPAFLFRPCHHSNSNRRKSKDVLLLAAVASDSSENERAVKRMKCSGMIISRRIHQSEGVEMMADLWIRVWGFQCN